MIANQLLTPLGRITVELDGRSVPFELTKLRPDDRLCPDVSDRYMLEIDFKPDHCEHLISCCLHPSQPVSGYSESGERLMCYGYYNKDESIKVSIGVESDVWYLRDKGGKLQRCSEYDYDDPFEKQDGVYINSFQLFPFTKTSHYVFGVSWLNHCSSENDSQTWFGADPTVMNKLTDALPDNNSAE